MSALCAAYFSSWLSGILPMREISSACTVDVLLSVVICFFLVLLAPHFWLVTMGNVRFRLALRQEKVVEGGWTPPKPIRGQRMLSPARTTEARRFKRRSE